MDWYFYEKRLLIFFKFSKIFILAERIMKKALSFSAPSLSARSDFNERRRKRIRGGVFPPLILFLFFLQGRPHVGPEREGDFPPTEL
ncbi:MAG: hypothetical protein LBH80_06195 [Prevotellaceae bacterium]|jgi:hypothetical protein|nr:hypothetical protein [Prevotellaceae bacterium]